MPRKMSKGFYIGGLFAGFVVSIILGMAVAVTFGVLAGLHPNDGPPLAMLGFLLLAMLPSVFSVVVYFMFIYRMWASIQDGQARMTPGAAVGLSFVPFFNIYWVFQVFQGFAQDYNKYLARRQLGLQRLNEELFLSYAIVTLFTMIPYLGMLALPVALVVCVIIMSKTCDAVNALSQVPQPAATVAVAATM